MTDLARTLTATGSGGTLTGSEHQKEGRMTIPLNIPQPPPELRALLNDPRLADMKDSPDKLARSTRILEPRNPPKPGESRYLLLQQEYDEPIRGVTWVNEPQTLAFHSRTGEGQGFSLVTERPRFEQSARKPISRQVWIYGNWLIASPAFADIVRRFDSGVVETVDIDWVSANGRLEGYSFFDVRRRLPAYDYARTRLVVQMHDGKKSISQLSHPRALKADIDPAIHTFREEFYRTHIYMSRPLAKAIVEAGVRGIRFEDPASVDTVTF